MKLVTVVNKSLAVGNRNNLGALVTDLFKNLTGIPQVQVDDLSNDDNGQDLTNYNFATDGFRMVTTPTNDVYLATAGTFNLPQQ